MIQEKDMHTTRPMGDNFFHILSILIIFRCNFSLSTYIPQYSNTIQLGLFGIWYVLAIIKHKDMFHYTLKVGWPLIVFLCINMTIDDLFMSEWTIITKNYILILIIFLIYLSYSLENDNKYKKIMITMIIFEFIYICFNTIKELATNPMYARMLASMKEELDYRGVAGFGHIYSYAFMLCGFIGAIFSKKSDGKAKIFLSCLVCLGSVLIFKASYLISIFIIFFELIYCALIRNSSKSGVRCAIIILCSLLVIITFSSIYEHIYEALGNDLLQDKFDDMSNFLAGKSASQTDGRIDRIMMSLNTFLKNPIWGVYGETVYEGIGRHSGFFDMLGMFGLLRGGLLILFFINAYRYILDRREEKEYKQLIKNVSLVFVLYTFVNPYEFQQLFVSLFITTPILGELIYASKYELKDPLNGNLIQRGSK